MWDLNREIDGAAQLFSRDRPPEGKGGGNQNELDTVGNTGGCIRKGTMRVL